MDSRVQHSLMPCELTIEDTSIGCRTSLSTLGLAGISDAKTELKCGKLSFRQVTPGLYAHVGLVNGILLSLVSMDLQHLPDFIQLTL